MSASNSNQTDSDGLLAAGGVVVAIVLAIGGYLLTRGASATDRATSGFETPWHSGNDPDAGVPPVLGDALDDYTPGSSSGGSGDGSHEPWHDGNDPDAGVPDVLYPDDDSSGSSSDDGTTWYAPGDSDSSGDGDSSFMPDDPWHDGNDPDAGVPNVLSG